MSSMSAGIKRKLDSRPGARPLSGLSESAESRRRRIRILNSFHCQKISLGLRQGGSGRSNHSVRTNQPIYRVGRCLISRAGNVSPIRRAEDYSFSTWTIRTLQGSIPRIRFLNCALKTTRSSESPHGSMFTVTSPGFWEATSLPEAISPCTA